MFCSSLFSIVPLDSAVSSDVIKPYLKAALTEELKLITDKRILWEQDLQTFRRIATNTKYKILANSNLVKKRTYFEVEVKLPVQH